MEKRVGTSTYTEIAYDASGTAYYYYADRLGSARLVKGSNNAQQESDYYPFGGERVVSGSVDNHYKFTGMERDAESGLDHTLFRQYASNLGRWLSTDAVRGDLQIPQTLNLYAYVANNPTNLIDPKGLHRCSPFDPECDFASRYPEPVDVYGLPFCGHNLGGGAPKCTESKSSKPRSHFGNLCADINGGKVKAKFIEEWTCTGGWSCCVEKKRAFVNSCYDRGPDYFATEQWPWGTPVVDCCYLPRR